MVTFPTGSFHSFFSAHDNLMGASKQGGGVDGVGVGGGVGGGGGVVVIVVIVVVIVAKELEVVTVGQLCGGDGREMGTRQARHCPNPAGQPCVYSKCTQNTVRSSRTFSHSIREWGPSFPCPCPATTTPGRESVAHQPASKQRSLHRFAELCGEKRASGSW